MSRKLSLRDLDEIKSIVSRHGLELGQIMLDHVDAIAAENEALRAVLQRAVDLYGKPGGPWNVPSDPGGWIEQARWALERK